MSLLHLQNVDNVRKHFAFRPDTCSKFSGRWQRPVWEFRSGPSHSLKNNMPRSIHGSRTILCISLLLHYIFKSFKKKCVQFLYHLCYVLKIFALLSFQLKICRKNEQSTFVVTAFQFSVVSSWHYKKSTHRLELSYSTHMRSLPLQLDQFDNAVNRNWYQRVKYTRCITFGKAYVIVRYHQAVKNWMISKNVIDCFLCRHISLPAPLPRLCQYVFLITVCKTSYQPNIQMPFYQAKIILLGWT